MKLALPIQGKLFPKDTLSPKGTLSTQPSLYLGFSTNEVLSLPFQSKCSNCIGFHQTLGIASPFQHTVCLYLYLFIYFLVFSFYFEIIQNLDIFFFNICSIFIFKKTRQLTKHSDFVKGLTISMTLNIGGHLFLFFNKFIDFNWR